jgi:hypothetical protein
MGRLLDFPLVAVPDDPTPHRHGEQYELQQELPAKYEVLEVHGL